MPYIASSSLIRFGIAVLTVLLTLMLMLILDPWVEMSGTPFILFFSAVILNAWFGGWNSGLLAIGLSALLSNYFFLDPQYELSLDIANSVKLGLFVLQGLLFTTLCVALKNAKRRDEVNLNKLKVSEERFRLALSSSEIVVFQQDSNLRYQWIHNPQGEATAEEILGKSDDELFPPAIAEQLTRIKRKVLERDISAREEVCVILHGQVLYYDLLVEPLKENNQIQGITCAAVNITQRQQVEQEKAKLRQNLQQAIQEKEESLALLNAWLASSPLALAFLDKELRYVYANEALAVINGVSQSQHLGRTVREVLPDWANQIEPILYGVMETKEPLLNQEVMGETYPSGVYRCGLVSYYPVCLPDGQLLGVGVTSLDITQKKRTEQALRESEARFRAIFSQAALGIALITVDGKFLQVNPALCQLTGYTHDELMQMNFQDITHPDDLETDCHQVQRVLAQEINSYSLEKRYIHKNGSIVWVNLTSSAVWNDEGEVQYALGIVEDITDRKQAQAAQNFLVAASTTLAASLDYEVTLNNVANLAVPTLADWCTVDILQPDWSIKRVAIASNNPQKRQILEEIQRRYPVSSEGKHPFYEKLLQGESVFYAEFPDSLLVEMARDEAHLQLLQSLGIRSLMVIPFYSHGQLFGVISFVIGESIRYYQPPDLALAEDIAHRAAIAIDNARLYQETQQAKQAAEIAASRIARLQSITAAFSEALTPQQVADVVVNQGIAALGASGGSVVLLGEGGKSLKIVEAIGYPASVRENWSSFPITAHVPIAVAARTGEPIFLENIAAFVSQYPIIADVPSLTGNCAFACIPLVVEQHTIGVLALSFATEQIFAAEDQRYMLTLAQQCAQAIARAQLYEAEKNARASAESANRIKDEFLTVLSHELRTPLNPILGWAKLLRTRKYDEATITQALETIERNAKLQTQLIDDLLDVSRILRGKLNLNIRRVDLRATITAALETVRLAADAKSIHIHTLLDDHISQVMGDSDRLQQVVWNLLSNAVKFTPPGGQVEVRLEQVGVEAQIQVMDTGKGITPEFLPHVFEYFRQADSKTTRAEGGLGLGLAIVRHFVELHGGTVQAESPGLGQGATFTFRLPLPKS
ncbi:PAS domain S-box protein [Nostoc sp. UHCC 0870]|uniref:PAS domain S-box protein n=1 Tax=Nostoc sp. UHCC 0870 TaxID=2914041 RepID=UPI001EDEC415|nr:PAS domain S-box protein [Nostoc sp. UHCC 0870]UKP00138.1 PAS domain S-box protein [Nostoc sp. UHCC 0870]